MAVFIAPGTLMAGELPPLIPRDVLLGNPDRTRPRISPDGKRLAYLAPSDGVMNVWVKTLGAADDQVLTRDTDRGVRYYHWAQDNTHILYAQDVDGDENWHVYDANLETKEIRDLTPFDNIQARIIAFNPKFPSHALIAINNRVPQFHDVYRVDIVSGEITLTLKNENQLVGFDVDREFQVRAGIRVAADGASELLVRQSERAPWTRITRWDPEDLIGSGSVTFTPDGRGLNLVTSSGSETRELRQIDLATGKERTLASDHSADVADFFIHPMTHVVQAVGFNKERLHWKVLDPAVRHDFRAIRRIRRGDFRIISRDNADATWVVAFTTDDGPVSYYRYDRENRESSFLFTNRKALEGLKLAKMVPISFQSSDGLTIHGYLTTPRGIKPHGLPLVLKVHSSAWGRDAWGYDGETQWLANRGYAVLQINARGSSGYGKSFLNAANRDWGGRMHQDLVDGVRWATRMKIADPQRVAIYGKSFGGYATLMGLATSPDLFACGVDISGWNNLLTLMKNLPPYLQHVERILWDRIGHPEKDLEFLKSRSPLFNAHRITRPLLIAQGASDPHTKKTETLQLVDTLRENGTTVEYIEYEDEGHGFDRPENRLDFLARAEEFLATHLGGRCKK